MPAVQLSNPSSIRQPQWLQDNSAGNALQQTYGGLGKYYDTSGLRDSAMAYNQNFANRAEMGFDAQARAAQNQAMRSGGRVGSNFVKGQLMLGLQGNLNSLQSDYSRLAAQMMASQGQQAGQLAGQMASYGLGRQNLMADWTRGQQGLGLQAQGMNQADARARAEMAQRAAMEQARLAQQGSQFDRTFASDESRFKQQFGLQSKDSAARNAALALQAMGPGGFLANLDNNGMPMSISDAQSLNRANQFTNQRNSYLSQLSGNPRAYG